MISHQTSSPEVTEIRSEISAAKAEDTGAPIKGDLHAMHDISKLRNEINSAIAHNSYIPMKTPPKQHKSTAAAPAEEEKIPFFKKFDLFKFLRGMRKKEAIVASQLNLTESDEYVSATNTVQRKLIQPNVVDSFAANGRPAQEPLSMHRETLQLLAVTEDLSFKLGDDVRAWKTVQATQQKHVLVGITQRQLLLVLEQNGDAYKIIQDIRFVGDIASFTVFLKWNGHAMEGVVVVALANELVFIRIEDSLQKMAIIWRWTIHQTVKTMLYFPLNDFDTLLLIHETANESSADIYRIDIPSKHTWLLQKIPLSAPCGSVEFVDIGRDSVVCFAQRDTVELYRYTHGTADAMQRFEHFESIDAPAVRTVASFRIGGLAYIAIGGRRPQILRYYREQFFAQTILSQSWGLVEQIVAIPARTYRDDLILFVQHRIAFASHSIPTLEALIWNGLAFETAAYAVPCYIGNQIVEAGITCVLDLDRDEGLTGSSIIQRGTQISLLVPRQSPAPSGLFHLKFQLVPTPPPILVDGIDPNEAIHNLVGEQDGKVDWIRAAARNSLAADETVNVAADWTIGSIKTDELEVGSEHLIVDELWVGDRQWRQADLQEDVQALLAELDTYQSALDELEKSSVKATIERIPSSAAANGLFNINSFRILRDKREDDIAAAERVEVTHLNVERINGVAVKDFIFLNDSGSLDLGAHALYLSEEIQVTDSVQVVPPSLSRAAVEETSLHVTGDVNVDTINGVHWTEFLSQIVMINLDYELDDVRVDGVRICFFILFLYNFSFVS